MPRGNRDEFSAKTKTLIEGRHASRCALCDHSTRGPHTDGGRTTNVGVAAHIAAAAPLGPRHDSSMTSAQRADAANGIWLCQLCSAHVDSDPLSFTVERVHRIKLAHYETLRAERGEGYRRPSARRGDASSSSLRVALAAHAIHDTRRIRAELATLPWDRMEEPLGRISTFSSDDYGPEVGIEVVRALARVASRLRELAHFPRRATPALEAAAHVVYVIDDVLSSVLPGQSRAPELAGDADALAFLDAAAHLSGEIAYDGANVLRDIRFVRAGAMGLWRQLLFASRSGLTKVVESIEEEFSLALKVALEAHGSQPFYAAHQVLAERRQEALERAAARSRARTSGGPFTVQGEAPST